MGTAEGGPEMMGGALIFVFGGIFPIIIRGMDGYNIGVG